MKSFLVAVIASAGILGTAHAGSTAEPFDGALACVVDGGACYSQIKVKQNGQPVTLMTMTLYYHEMDLPAGQSQPILGLTFPFESGANAARCQQYIPLIQADETQYLTTQDYIKFPYLEFVIAPNAKQQIADDGTTAYWLDKDIRCWEAHDLSENLF